MVVGSPAGRPDIVLKVKWRVRGRGGEKGGREQRNCPVLAQIHANNPPSFSPTPLPSMGQRHCNLFLTKGGTKGYLGSHAKVLTRPHAATRIVIRPVTRSTVDRLCQHLVVLKVMWYLDAALTFRANLSASLVSVFHAPSLAPSSITLERKTQTSASPMYTYSSMGFPPGGRVSTRPACASLRSPVSLGSVL